MQNKPMDVPYCGCRESKIDSAKPVLSKKGLQYLYQFITERYKIHLRKDVLCLPKPWTNDPILRSFKFTNVRREHDRETKWVIEHIVDNPKLSYNDKILNIILFRMYNKHETFELLKLPKSFSKSWDPETYRLKLEDIRTANPHYVYFTGAFNTGGIKVHCKTYMPDTVEDLIPLRILYFFKHLQSTGIVDKIKKAEKQSDVTDALMEYNGLGKFLSYQIFVDFTYIPEFPFSENEYTMAGPGCSLGLKQLFINTDRMTDEECLFWLRNNLDRLFQKHIDLYWNPKYLFTDLPLEERHFNVMSLENCFCELSKYIRACTGTGRPRKTYKGDA